MFVEYAQGDRYDGLSLCASSNPYVEILTSNVGADGAFESGDQVTRMGLPQTGLAAS